MLLRIFAAIAAASTLFFFTPQRAFASCGLHVCPLPVQTKISEQTPLALPSQVFIESRYASFDIGGKGGYLQTSLAGIYEHTAFRAGAVLPIVYLDGPQGSTTGLGNAVAFGEYHLVTAGLVRLSLGSQLEMPTGNHDRGLAANHFMAIPYANFWLSAGALRIAAQAGYQQTLGSHAHGAAAPVLYVNPHSDSEIISRLMTSYTWAQSVTAEVNASFRQVTAHDAIGDKSFLDLGGAMRVMLGQNMALRAGADFPLTSRARYLFQAHLSLFYYF